MNNKKTREFVAKKYRDAGHKSLADKIEDADSHAKIWPIVLEVLDRALPGAKKVLTDVFTFDATDPDVDVPPVLTGPDSGRKIEEAIEDGKPSEQGSDNPDERQDQGGLDLRA